MSNQTTTTPEQDKLAMTLANNLPVINGWKPDTCRYSGATTFEKKGFTIAIGATPNWDGMLAIPVNVFGEDGEYGDWGQFPFIPTADMAADIAAYVAIIEPVIRRIEIVTLAAQ